MGLVAEPHFRCQLGLGYVLGILELVSILQELDVGRSKCISSSRVQGCHTETSEQQLYRQVQSSPSYNTNSYASSFKTRMSTE